MKSNKAFVAIASLTALALGICLSPAAKAEPVQVQRGPNGAASVVDATKIPLDAQVINPSNIQPNPYPELSVRGPHGAAHLMGTSRPKTSASVPNAPRIINRGPNGAAFVVN
ncbi:MAG: hypothetical protein ACFCU8_20765 [Thermosynechococcaceae cyanobacterium]